MRFSLPTFLICLLTFSGCGTTKWSDTSRTATEQLLISDAMDRAVVQLDFRAVAGKTVYLDSGPLAAVTDSPYLVSLMRQHMLASGCILKEKREEADYVVEVRAGAVGTDRREVVFGMPATKVSGMLPLNGVPSALPEMPLATRTDQRAVAKIAVFAYNRKTGRPVWQSGVVPVESTAQNIWVLGAGPFQRGSIFDGTSFVGSRIKIPLLSPKKKPKPKPELVSVLEEAFFAEPEAKTEREESVAREEQLAEDDRAAEPEPAPPAAAEAEVAENVRSEAAEQVGVGEVAGATENEPTAASGEVIPAGHTAPVAPVLPGSPQPPPEQAPSEEAPQRLPQDPAVPKLLPRPPEDISVPRFLRLFRF